MLFSLFSHAVLCIITTSNSTLTKKWTRQKMSTSQHDLGFCKFCIMCAYTWFISYCKLPLHSENCFLISGNLMNKIERKVYLLTALLQRTNPYRHLQDTPVFLVEEQSRYAYTHYTHYRPFYETHSNNQLFIFVTVLSALKHTHLNPDEILQQDWLCYHRICMWDTLI